MDGLAFCPVSAATPTSLSVNPAPFCSFTSVIRLRSQKYVFVTKKFKSLSVSASKKEDPKLDEWDLMELKFGRMLGEDPKLTMAKIMGRKINPGASYLEIEKAFYKNKGKMPDVEEVPLDWFDEKKPTSASSDRLNLARPVRKKGTQSETNDQPNMPELKKPSQSLRRSPGNAVKGTVPNVILRKPRSYYQDDTEDETKLRLKPNLNLKMRNEESEKKFSDMTLLRKPEPMKDDSKFEKKEESVSGYFTAGGTQEDSGELKLGQEERDEGGYVDFTLLKKPESKPTLEEEKEHKEEIANRLKDEVEESSDIRSNLMPMDIETEENEPTPGAKQLNHSDASVPLQGKPQRLDQSVTVPSETIQGQALVNNEGQQNPVELKGPPSRLASEDSDWVRAENLLSTEARVEVELISSSTRGFAASFGSLIGFLPYRNLAAKWKFLAFESWLRRRGIDPSIYRQNLGVIGSHDAMVNSELSLDPYRDPETEKMIEGEISSDMKLEDLLRIYDHEKQTFLSSFVGQRIHVNVVLVDKNSRKLIFSMRPREKAEVVEKKRNLMAKLRVGDVVKCCIKKITYFGIFVEVEGVPALIHQTEVSWDATLDLESYFKIGQVVEAKVHQLDFTLDRIFLSLKQTTPDPLGEALESVIGDHSLQNGSLQAAEPDSEWPDVESLIKELQKIDGIESVSKGRFFLSPGLAPTFQVYMASMFENQYKLLARSGNNVQEVIVESSLGKEEMKSTIMSCTNRVE